MFDDKLVDSELKQLVPHRIPILISIRGPLVGRIFYLKEPVVPGPSVFK